MYSDKSIFRNLGKSYRNRCFIPWKSLEKILWFLNKWNHEAFLVSQPRSFSNHQNQQNKEVRPSDKNALIPIKPRITYPLHPYPWFCYRYFSLSPNRIYKICSPPSNFINTHRHCSRSCKTLTPTTTSKLYYSHGVTHPRAPRSQLPASWRSCISSSLRHHNCWMTSIAACSRSTRRPKEHLLSKGYANLHLKILTPPPFSILSSLGCALNSPPHLLLQLRRACRLRNYPSHNSCCDCSGMRDARNLARLFISIDDV